MNKRLILAATSFGTLLSSSAFAQDGGASGASDAPKMTVQAQVELLPLGTAKATVAGTSQSSDTAVAYGISGAVDYAVTPYLRIGVAPRLVLNVKPNDAMADASADKQLDLRARIQGHYPVAAGLELSASLYPGYTFVLSSQDGASNANGFAIGGAVGASYDLSPRVFVAAEVGYQRAFTSADSTVAGQTISGDLDMSYMHIGLGAGTRF
jgi:opacity protein-like surface antigen